MLTCCSGRLPRKSILTAVFGLLFAVLAQAGELAYVEFYEDANFNKKMGRIIDVAVDVCYNLACDNLRNKISSVKWGGLPDTREHGYNTIEFHTRQHCEDHHKRSWPVRTQKDDDLYFPMDFKQDGIDNAIRSFRVMDKRFIKRYSNVCTESAVLNSTDRTVSEMTSSNNTVGGL